MRLDHISDDNYTNKLFLEELTKVLKNLGEFAYRKVVSFTMFLIFVGTFIFASYDQLHAVNVVSNSLFYLIFSICSMVNIRDFFALNFEYGRKELTDDMIVDQFRNFCLALIPFICLLIS